MIHKTAIVSKEAKLAKDVEIGPFCIIGPKVKISQGVQVANSCVIDGNTTIGAGCKIYSGAIIGSIPQDLKYKGEDTKLTIGDNNIIREYTTINIGTGRCGITKIGNSSLIMAYSHIAHDCLIGDNCVLANCATLAGHVTIEDKATIGGLVAIHQFVKVGKLSIIGGCSKVVQDVLPFSTCDGHPARVYGLNILGLKRSKVASKTITALKVAFKYLFFSGLSKTNAIEKIQSDISDNPEVAYLINFLKSSSSRGIARGAKT